MSFIAVLVVVSVLYPTLAFFEPRYHAYFGMDTLGLVSYFEKNSLIIFGSQFLALLLVTTFSTSLAMRKYLKV